MRRAALLATPLWLGWFALLGGCGGCADGSSEPAPAASSQPQAVAPAPSLRPMVLPMRGLHLMLRDAAAD